MAQTDLTNYRALDPGDMYAAIRDFPAQMRTAIALTDDAPKLSLGRIKRVVILGMGGSAIGGDLLRSYVSSFDDHNGVEVVVSRDYIPPQVGKSDLVVVGSYSGNTEETLTAFAAARKNAGKVVAVTTGGKLRKSATKEGYPIVMLPAGYQPRAALGLSFFPLLNLLAVREKLFGEGVARETTRGMKEAIALVEKLSDEYGAAPGDANRAFTIAQSIHTRVPVIYSTAQLLDSVNLRWRGQIQENAKNLAFGNLLPEMNHNEINGWSFPDDIVTRCVPIFLHDKADHRRNVKRLEITRRIIAQSSAEPIMLETEGKTRLARMFSLIHLGDWVSYWLAILNGVDPSPVPVIESLKGELAG